MVNRPRNIGIDTDILQDFTARTKAIQQQANDELTAFGVMRPKSEEEKIIANLKRFADQGVGVPTVQSQDIAEINAALEKSLNDPFYKRSRTLPQKHVHLIQPVSVAAEYLVSNRTRQTLILNPTSSIRPQDGYSEWAVVAFLE
jgi:hypothetical protein